MKINLKKAPKKYLKFLRDLSFKEIKYWHKMECIAGKGEESRKEIKYWRDFLDEINKRQKWREM